MQKTKNEQLRKWELATQSLTDFFISKYFNEKDYKPDWYWIGDVVGDTLFINDYFFNLNEICDFIRCDYSVDDMFAYSDLKLTAAFGHKGLPNIQNWRELRIVRLKNEGMNP